MPAPIRHVLLVAVGFATFAVAAACRGEKTATIEGPPLTIGPPGDASPRQDVVTRGVDANAP